MRPGDGSVQEPNPSSGLRLQDAKYYCTQVRDMIKLLKSNRDMAFNEIKLTVMIEDPRARERRENLGIEVGRMQEANCSWVRC